MWFNNDHDHDPFHPIPNPFAKPPNAARIIDPFSNGPPSRRHHHHKPRPSPPPSFFPPSPSSTATDYTPDFEPLNSTHIRVPPRSSHHLRTGDILILPATLTRLKISLYSSPSASSSTYAQRPLHTLRATAAGDMRLRDALKQVLAHELIADARVSVKLGGEWSEAQAPVKMSEIAALGPYAVNERVGVEVQVVIGGNRVRARREGRGGGGGVPRFGWEREIVGEVERMRMY